MQRKSTSHNQCTQQSMALAMLKAKQLQFDKQ